MNRINDLREVSMTIEQIDNAIANARYERSVVFRSLVSSLLQKLNPAAARRGRKTDTAPNTGSIGLTDAALERNVEFGQAMGRWMNVVLPYRSNTAGMNK